MRRADRPQAAGRRALAPSYRVRTALLLLLLLLIAGCGGEDRVPLFPATGRVLVDDRPAAGVQVRLHPTDRPDDLDALVPFAVTGEDGGFGLGTFEDGDGAPAGRYRATLYWPDRPPGPSPPTDRLGGRYDDAGRSPFSVTITEGENTLEPFRVESAPTAPQPQRRGPADVDLDGLGAVPPP
ncbi:hypothetical protein [Tautonia sociabilis]|uniref:Carboxypeptidase regulatory-like domain-containing protein n=1 Tax=Tautonia sociabilis TaxID=2080755 RepID=A0A432MDP9_9BACT|nr:hypothetical protein [Tautonia sociabilis]RUL82960.1 hypothetical protein TsocGM_22955 [Tautonia sociabilis]